MELKEIPIDDIFVNPAQPRTKIDEDKIKELADSIKINGLLNPIIVKEEKNGKFMIIAGEMRWQAHKELGLDKIKCSIKEYDKDIDWQVDSLIENIQRTDLTSVERENYISQLWKSGEFKDKTALGKRIGMTDALNIINAKEERDRLHISPYLSTRTISDLAGLEDKDKRKMIGMIENKKIQQQQIREYKSFIQKAPEDIKNAIFNSKINLESAKKIVKLKDYSQRLKAVRAHKMISEIEGKIEKRIQDNSSKTPIVFNSKDWIDSFKIAIIDAKLELENVFKKLMTATQFIPQMGDEELEELDVALNSFSELIYRTEEVSDKIRKIIDN